MEEKLFDPKKPFDEDRVKKLLVWAMNPCNVVKEEDETVLFLPELRLVLFEYLNHHSISEQNQELLFEPKNTMVLNFFIRHWVLAKDLEKKLFKPELRLYLRFYIERGSLHAAENELLFFTEHKIDKFRKMYIERYAFHDLRAEEKLFEPEFKADLELYVAKKHIIFPDLVKRLKEEHHNLYMRYVAYCPKDQIKADE